MRVAQFSSRQLLDGLAATTPLHLTKRLPGSLLSPCSGSGVAFAPDFSGLNDTRAGYGGIPDPNRDRLAPEDAGIWRIDFQIARQQSVFSFADPTTIPFQGRPEAAFGPRSKHRFHHLLCNPDGRKVVFDSLHRGGRQVYMADISDIIGV